MEGKLRVIRCATGRQFVPYRNPHDAEFRGHLIEVGGTVLVVATAKETGWYRVLTLRSQTLIEVEGRYLHHLEEEE